MADQPSRTYSDLIALLVAAVIMLIMISITEAAASHGHLLENLDAPSRDHVRGVDQALAKKNVSAARAALHQADLAGLHGDRQPWPGASWGEGSGHDRVNPSTEGAR